MPNKLIEIYSFEENSQEEENSKGLFWYEVLKNTEGCVNAKRKAGKKASRDFSITFKCPEGESILL